MADGPAVVGPYSSDSVEIGVKDGVATIADQRGWISVGFDGSNYRFLRTNSSGQQVFVGAGIAGTPAGGVLSVQGVVGGTPVPISATSLPLPSGAATEATLSTRLAEATFTTRIPTLGQKAMAGSMPVVVASDQSAIPVSQSGAWSVTQGSPPWAFATEIQIDYDTGAGSVPLSVMGLALPGAGGPVAGGTATNPVRVDPTGTTVQPVSDNGSSLTVDDGGGSLSVDTTQLPGSLVGGRLDTNVGSWMGATTPTVGQKAMAASLPVALASDQSSIPVTQSGAWSVEQGSPPWAIATEVQLDYDTGAGSQPLSLMGLALPASGGAVAGGTSTNPLRTDPTGTTTQPVSDAGGSLTVDDGGGTLTVDDGGTSLTVDSVQLPGALVGGRLDTNVGSWMGATTPTVGQKAMAASLPVAIASDQTRVPVSGTDADGAAPTTNPVLVAGMDGTNVQTLKTDTTGRQEVIGGAADGAAVAGNPVLVAGQDGANARSLLTDTAGRPRVVGAADEAAGAVGSPVRSAGWDGAALRTLKTDASGRQLAVGAADNGAAVAGAPVRVGGSDGTDTRDILTDTGGRQVAVGAGVNGAAVVGNPVLTAGYDGTNARTELTDTAGRQRVVGAAASGAAVVGDPVRAAGSDGTNTRDLKTNAAGRLEEVLYDGSGNPVGVILDGSIYRLQTAAQVEKWFGSTAPTVGQKVAASSLPVIIASDQSTLPVSIGGGNPTTVVSDFLRNGGSDSMDVDGSGAAVHFDFDADATDDIVISSLRFVFTAGGLNFDGSNFGKGGGSLSNGILVSAIVNGGTAITIATLTKNEDLLRLQGRALTELGGINDVLQATIEFSGRVLLEGGSADRVRVSIQDDLTIGSRDVKYLTCTFFGVKE